jgi:hypothetical protein
LPLPGAFGSGIGFDPDASGFGERGDGFGLALVLALVFALVADAEAGVACLGARRCLVGAVDCDAGVADPLRLGADDARDAQVARSGDVAGGGAAGSADPDWIRVLTICSVDSFLSCSLSTTREEGIHRANC